MHHFNYPPSVAFFSISRYLPLQSAVGNPINPYYISSFLTGYSDHMTFFQRLENTFYVLYELYIHNYHTHVLHDAVLKKTFGQDVPSTWDLERNNSLLLLSGDITQDYPIPLQPNTIPVGTTHIKNNLTPLQSVSDI